MMLSGCKERAIWSAALQRRQGRGLKPARMGGAEAPHSTSATDRVVLEAGLLDDLAVVDPPAVEDDPLLEGDRYEVPIELLEFVPLGYEHESIGALGHLEGAVHIVDLREDFAHVVGGYRVVGPDS